MPTVFANARGIAHKGSGGLTIAFPDVCYTPLTNGAVPPHAALPYPGFASTAQANRKKRQGMGVKVSGTPTFSSGGGSLVGTKTGSTAFTTMGAPGVLKDVGTMSSSPKKNSEAQQLKGAMNQLNIKLQNMMTADPDRWQSLLAEYAVAVGALFVTLTDQDDDD